MDLTLINFDAPTETRSFEKGRFELYRVGPMTLGRATYDPGWRWSEHVGAATGQALCPVEHVGLVISGRAAVLMEDGTERVMAPGDFFYVPSGHDSWVVGGRALCLAARDGQRELRLLDQRPNTISKRSMLRARSRRSHSGLARGLVLSHGGGGGVPPASLRSGLRSVLLDMGSLPQSNPSCTKRSASREGQTRTSG